MINRIDNCIVVIDNYTKEIVDDISFYDISNNVPVITDILELDDNARGKRIIIFEPILYTSVTLPMIESLKREYGCTFILAYSNEAACQIYSNACILKQCNYSSIDITLIYALAMDDNIILLEYRKSVETIGAYRNIKMKIPREYQNLFDVMHDSMCYIGERYNAMLSQSLMLLNQEKALDSQFKRIKKGVSDLSSYYENMHSKVTEYETRLSASYDKQISGTYNDKPVILYFKENQHLSGFDVLLNTLYYVLTVQYTTSCKILKVVDTTNAKEVQFVPDVYKILENRYNNKEVFVNDFILKRGAYDQIVDTLLLNRAKLKCLIIHDMRGTTSPIIDPKLINSFVNIISPEYTEFFENQDFITSEKIDGALYWNSSLYSDIAVDKRLIAMSSHPTVLSLLERLI